TASAKPAAPPKKTKSAARPAPPPPASSEPPPPAVPPRVTLHVWSPEKATGFEPEERVEAAMEEVLVAEPRLRFTPFANIVAPADEPFQALTVADQALADAKKAYADMDVERAKQLLQTALKTYQKHLPALASRPDGVSPMRDGFIELSKARFFEGNLDGSRDALRYAFVLDGTVRWNKTFPPQMKKTVVEARLLYDTLGVGKLIIDSDPPGATVWLNGQKLPERTPTQSIDAPNGPNFISYARRGYAPMTQAFEVAGGNDEARPLATLSRYAKNPLAPIDRARARIEDSPAPRTLKDACAMLNVDMLVLVKSARPGERDDETPQTLTAYLYDARNFRIINRLEMHVEGDVQATARVMARELFHGTRLDGVYFAPVAASQPKWHERLWSSVNTDLGRFRHWKGFWYVVGGVAGAVVVGTVVGVTASHQRQIAVDTVLLGGH
ncbi:MAG: hypothetical protein JWN44_6879, partial [Myxococcales bacterium]|nr:hypothetical protein [Myxococcales bacterium]